MMIHAVIVYIIKDGKILLHYKKRGHGAGKWNGVGGKIEENESIEDCAKREAREEMGTDIENIEKIGEITFYDVNGEDWLAHVFRADLTGEPKESEESYPKWFPIKEIPYDEMWEDDRYWLPLVINDIHFKAKFWFSGEKMLKFVIEGEKRKKRNTLI